MMDSVVSSRPATLAPFCRAMRVTLTGSTIAGLAQVVVARRCRRCSRSSCPCCLRMLADDDGAVHAGVLGDQPARHLQGARTAPATPSVLVAGRASGLSSALRARSRATPPPGTMPSAIAARVACRASSYEGLALLHLGLGRGADLDLGDAAGQLRQPLLQLLAVVLAVGRGRSRGGSSRPGPRSPCLSPAPSVMVVFSASILTFLARPRSASLTFSSSMPRSLKIALPPVRMAMSSSMALRRSP